MLVYHCLTKKVISQKNICQSLRHIMAGKKLTWLVNKKLRHCHSTSGSQRADTTIKISLPFRSSYVITTRKLFAYLRISSVNQEIT